MIFFKCLRAPWERQGPVEKKLEPTEENLRECFLGGGGGHGPLQEHDDSYRPPPQENAHKHTHTHPHKLHPFNRPHEALGAPWSPDLSCSAVPYVLMSPPTTKETLLSWGSLKHFSALLDVISLLWRYMW